MMSLLCLGCSIGVRSLAVLPPDRTTLTVSRPFSRLLMLCFFVALQAMAPFIHAHAGAVRLDHAGFLHVHQGVHNDAAWHVVAMDEHGAEVEVAQGVPARNERLGLSADAPATAPQPPRVEAATHAEAGLPAPMPPPPRPTQPAHTLPHALAPPHA